jgi:hypothetical protein
MEYERAMAIPKKGGQALSDQQREQSFVVKHNVPKLLILKSCRVVLCSSKINML